MSQIFPKLVALAERAWHRADWEEGGDDDRTRDAEKEADWESFANSLGYKELARLDAVLVDYYVAPPGARYQNIYPPFKSIGSVCFSSTYIELRFQVD